jgi:transposase
MPLIKYDSILRSRIIELCLKGHTDNMISQILGISVRTLYRWKNNHKNLKDDMEKARTLSAQDIIVNSTRKLAQGCKVEEIIEESIEQDINGNPKKVKRIVKEILPDVKAIEVLARIYAPEYAKEGSSESDSTVSVSVDFSGMTFADLLEYNRNNNPLDVPVNDYKHLEESSDDGEKN